MSYFEQEYRWLLNEKYRGKRTKDFYKDVIRLKKGEPIDYVIGYTTFLNSKIDLSLKPLIPRPETEYWVEKAIQEIKKEEQTHPLFLDIFAGSGCIGLSILKNIKKSKVDFADKNDKFLRQIKISLKLNKIKPERYKIIKSDIFKNINRRYNYIFANPPYVDLKHPENIEPSVLKFEPKRAILAKDGGLDYIKKFLKEAKNHSLPKGKIYMEFGFNQKKQIIPLLKKYNYKNFKFYKDQYYKWRWISIKN